MLRHRNCAAKRAASTLHNSLRYGEFPAQFREHVVRIWWNIIRFVWKILNYQLLQKGTNWGSLRFEFCKYEGSRLDRGASIRADSPTSFVCIPKKPANCCSRRLKTWSTNTWRFRASNEWTTCCARNWEKTMPRSRTRWARALASVSTAHAFVFSNSKLERIFLTARCFSIFEKRFENYYLKTQ